MKQQAKPELNYLDWLAALKTSEFAAYEAWFDQNMLPPKEEEEPPAQPKKEEKRAAPIK